MEKALERLAHMKVSLSSTYITFHRIFNGLWTLVAGIWISYYHIAHSEMVCHKNSGKEVVLEHCWSALYYLKSTNGTDQHIIDVNTWMLLYPFLTGQFLLLIIPFFLWSCYDKKYLVTSCHEFKDDAKKLADFFLNTFRGNGNYIFTFHIFEMLHMVVVTVVLYVKTRIFKLEPMDLLSILMNKEPSILDSIFPDSGICTDTRTSHIPGLPDVDHFKCLLHLNWLRRTIFLGNSWWLVILWCFGIFQLVKTLAFVLIKPLRVFRLKLLGGKLGSKLKICHIGDQLDYADYMVALGLGSRLTSSTFNEFVVALYNRLVPAQDSDDELDDNQQDTIQMTLWNQSGMAEEGHLASVQQCDD